MRKQKKLLLHFPTCQIALEPQVALWQKGSHFEVESSEKIFIIFYQVQQTIIQVESSKWQNIISNISNHSMLYGNKIPFHSFVFNDLWSPRPHTTVYDGPRLPLSLFDQ